MLLINIYRNDNMIKDLMEVFKAQRAQHNVCNIIYFGIYLICKTYVMDIHFPHCTFFLVGF